MSEKKPYLIGEISRDIDNYITNVSASPATDSSSIYYLTDEDAELVKLAAAGDEEGDEFVLIPIITEPTRTIDSLIEAGRRAKERKLKAEEEKKLKAEILRRQKEVMAQKEKEVAARKERELFEHLKAKYLGEKIVD